MKQVEIENSLEQKLFTKASINKIPLYGVLELLPVCNMNCKMCYVRLNQDEVKAAGGLLSTEEWIHIAGQMKAAGTLFTVLTGGEPLLYPGFKEVYLELKRLGMILTINTNGTLLDEEWADFFSENRPRRVNITLYGASGKSYEEICGYEEGFQKALHAIKLLKERNIDVKMNVSLIPWNEKEWKQILDTGRKMQIPVKIDTYMYPVMRERCGEYPLENRLAPEEAGKLRMEIMKEQLGEQAFQEYVEKMKLQIESEDKKLKSGKEKPVTCSAGSGAFAVTWQGKLKPCVMFATEGISLSEIRFTDAWYQTVKEMDTIQMNETCRKCEKRILCNACVASAAAETGKMDGVSEYLCRYANAMKEIIYREKIRK